MNNINYFKIGTIIFSIILGIVAILIFSGKFPGIENESQAENQNRKALVVWGIVPRAIIDKVSLETTQAIGKPFQINYTQFSSAALQQELLRADALNYAPDLIIANSDTLTAVSSLLSLIPYNYMTELEYKNMYVDSSHIYLSPYGAQFYPIAIDPLITFYNKKLLREAGLTNPPQKWLELPKYEEKLTVKTTNNIPNISAFGIGANNVLNQKDILFANLLQLGHNPAAMTWGIGFEREPKQFFNVGLGLDSSNGNDEGDIYKILRFQTAFSDPQKSVFTWSEVDILDKEKFANGQMGLYFGKASDYYDILTENPNIDMGIYFLPQMDNRYILTTGDILGVAITSKTADINYAVEVSQIIAGNAFGAILSNYLGVSSARKDILAGTDGSERAQVIGGAALNMQKYYDNNPIYLSGIVSDLYENIISGRKSISEAVNSFSREWLSAYNINNQ
jgi:ABC-type glycerol-3-phosphate transport system substrate-binding protein